MEPESIAHLAGLSGCLSQLDRPEVPPAQRMVFQFMQNEIMAIVKIEGIEGPFKTMLDLASSIYKAISPQIDEVTANKSNAEIEDMLRSNFNLPKGDDEE